jgi:hypothetical protein
MCREPEARTRARTQRDPLGVTGRLTGVTAQSYSRGPLAPSPAAQALAGVDRNFLCVDLVVFSFATMHRFHIERVPEDKRNVKRLGYEALVSKAVPLVNSTLWGRRPCMRG